MYYYLRGTIVEKYFDSIIIDVSGVGYQILMSHPESFNLGENALVYISHIVREDEQYFVGFSSLKEKEVFSKLITCKGIGPKTALSALRDISLDEFIFAISNSDVKRLKKLNGIGPKAASQIILDLHGVLTFNENSSKVNGYNKNQEDARSALKNLGFKLKDIDECISRIDESLSTSEIVTQVLKIIRKG